MLQRISRSIKFKYGTRRKKCLLFFGNGGCVIALNCCNISVYTIVGLLGCGGVCTNVTIIVSVACRKGNTSTLSPPSPRLKQ